MRNPIDVLKSLAEHSTDNEYKYDRLYRNLYNSKFYMLAYKNIAKSQGSMTAGTDGLTLDNMTTTRIDKLIQSLKDHSYHPKPARRTYIAKKNSIKKRPLGISSTNDKLVQEVVHMLLEAIYEPTFSRYSHGFRPNRSCHTALTQISSVFKGTRWLIEGDIKACFDSFDHHILVNILRKRIKDEYFISLIWKLLKAGYMEQWTYFQTYSGTAQGSGCSPILANIYLNELDEFVENYKQVFNKGNSRNITDNKVYRSIEHKLRKQLGKYNAEKDTLTRQERKERLKPTLELRKQLHSESACITNDPNYKQLVYNRYADDFLIGINGTKEDTLKVKTDIGEYLKNTLGLIMSEEKTKVTHSAELVRYLGYDITVGRDKSTKRDKRGTIRKTWYGKVGLYLPNEKWVGKLREYGAFKAVPCGNGEEFWKPLPRGKLVNKTDIEILSKYNAEIRGSYNYYKLANNASVLEKFAFIMAGSMHKTFAAKYRTTARKIREKYTKDSIFGVEYRTKSMTKRCEFYHYGFKKQTVWQTDENVDMLPNLCKYGGMNSFANRLKAGKCELCSCKTDEIHIHHVRALKELAGKTPCEQIMLAKRRKSVALCTECFRKEQDL